MTGVTEADDGPFHQNSEAWTQLSEEPLPSTDVEGSEPSHSTRELRSVEKHSEPSAAPTYMPPGQELGKVPVFHKTPSLRDGLRHDGEGFTVTQTLCPMPAAPRHTGV